jgi:hypothetical protein
MMIAVDLHPGQAWATAAALSRECEQLARHIEHTGEVNDTLPDFYADLMGAARRFAEFAPSAQSQAEIELRVRRLEDAIRDHRKAVAA